MSKRSRVVGLDSSAAVRCREVGYISIRDNDFADMHGRLFGTNILFLEHWDRTVRLFHSMVDKHEHDCAIIFSVL